MYGCPNCRTYGRNCFTHGASNSFRFASSFFPRGVTGTSRFAAAPKSRPPTVSRARVLGRRIASSRTAPAQSLARGSAMFFRGVPRAGAFASRFR